MNTKRVFIATMTGALLGIVCIAGVGLRIGFKGNLAFLLAVWYNRVLMGLLIGLASDVELIKSDKNKYLRGFVLGALVTVAISFSTGFRDLPSFFAGIAYGVIIDYLASKFG